MITFLSIIGTIFGIFIIPTSLGAWGVWLWDDAMDDDDKSLVPSIAVGVLALLVLALTLTLVTRADDNRSCAKYEYRTVMIGAMPTQQRHCVEYWENTPGSTP